MARIRERWGDAIAAACRYSSVPAKFLAALIANESGGNENASRFEAGVYRHLCAVRDGHEARYGSITREALQAVIPASDVIPAKAGIPRGQAPAGIQPGDPGSSLPPGSPLSRGRPGSGDDVMRDLATSWGLTQIMGYHVLSAVGAVREPPLRPQDLLRPEIHLPRTLRLLAEFADRYGLDLTTELAELFRCWNTGGPYGTTFDPEYVEKGLRRLALYASGEKAEGGRQ